MNKFVFKKRVKYWNLHALGDADCEEKTKDYRAQRDLAHRSFRLTKQQNEPGDSSFSF